LKVLLDALGYKKDESIVPYLKDYKNVEQVPENLEKDDGEFYSTGSKKLTYQAVSTGLYKNTCHHLSIKWEKMPKASIMPKLILLHHRINKREKKGSSKQLYALGCCTTKGKSMYAK
jgi:hypothetical protein